MKEFYKRNTIILQVASIFILLLSFVGIIIVFTSLPEIKTFLESNVFHRALEESTFSQKISRLLNLPFFLVITLNALVFLKYSDKNKIILLASFGILFFALLVFTFFYRCTAGMNADMASELVLAKECARAKTFWPRTWYYSTEFRLLNTQLISGILFLFTNKWVVVKALTAAICIIAIAFAQNFLLQVIGIRKNWLKLLVCIMSICPTTYDVWNIVTFGNYYVPHIVIGFVYIALFLKLCKEEANGSKKRLALKILFFVLSFLNGLAGIRYVLSFQIPLFLSIFFPKINEQVKKGQCSLKDFLLQDSYVFFSGLAFFLCALGYGFNSFVLSKLYKFSSWSYTDLCGFDIGVLKDEINFIFETAGFRKVAEALAPSGFVCVLSVIMLIAFVGGLVSFYKTNNDKSKRIIVSLFLTSFIFMIFFLSVIFREDIPMRYFYPSLAFFFPSFAVVIENETFNKWHKWILCTSASVVLLCSGVFTIQDVMIFDTNVSSYAVHNFLKEKDYTFGYASFWNANVHTFMSDGIIEVADIGDGEDIPTMFESYSIHRFLTLSRYYKDDYHSGEKCFLLVAENQYQKSTHCRLFSQGKEVYSDGNFRVFEYASPEEFRQSF